MKNLDGQVLALLAEHLLHLLLEDQARPMMGVYDLVAELVHRRLTVDLEVLDELVFQNYFADDVPLLRYLGRNPARRLVSGLQIPIHEVDLL
jgi:hypothetical protein